VDGLLDEGQGESLIRLVGMSELRIQMQVRALLFRLVCWSDLCQSAARLDSKRYEYLNGFKRATDLIELIVRSYEDEAK